jgi:hypothetical protein
LSRSRFTPLLWLTLSGLGTLSPRPANAQNPAAAEALFEQARAAMAAGSFDIACARFRDSDKLDPAVGTRFNLADCEERRGRVATAWSLFRGVLSELAEDDDRRPIAQQRVRALEPRLPYLTMQRAPTTPAGVHVRIDGVELSEGSFGVALPMDPGAHDLILLPPAGGEGERSTFALREGERRELPILLGAGAPPADSTEPLTSSEPFASASSRQKWVYIAGGVGVTGVLFGSVTGIVALNKKSTADANCSDDRHVCNQAGVDANESGKTYGTLSGLGLGVGVVGLAAAAYLWLTGPQASQAPTHAAHPSIPVHRGLRVRPEVACTNGAGFLSVSGSF